MVIAIVIALYMIILFWGCRQIKGKRKTPLRLLYGVLIVYSSYIHISGMLNVPFVSLSAIYKVFFQPIGGVIIHWLGG